MREGREFRLDDGTDRIIVNEAFAMRYFAGRSVLGRTIRNGRLTQTVIETSWRLVLRQGMAAAALGIVLGIVAALGLARLVSSMLLGVAPPS